MRLSAFIFVFVLVQGLHWSHAQAPARVDSLTAMDVVAEVLQHNFDIQVAAQNLELAELNNSWGETGRYPSINLIVGNQNSYTNQNNPASVFGEAQILDINGRGAIEANWRIFGGLRTYINKQRLALLEEQSEGNAEIIIQNAVQAALMAYQSALIARVQLDVLKEAATFSEERLDFTKTKEAIGTISSFVTLQDELAYQTDQTNVLQQKLNYNNAIRELNLLMGRDPMQPLALADELVVDTTQFDYSTLKAMLSENADLQNEYVNLEIFKRDVQLQRRAQMPTLDLNTGASRSYSYGELSSEQFNRTGSGSSYSFYANFTLSFNLFNGGQTRRAIQRAEINEHISRTTIRQMRNSLENELARLYDQYTIQLQILALSEGRLRNAQKNLRLAKARYDGGLINTFDFRAIQLEQLQAEQTRLEIVQQLKLTQIELLRLTGQILPKTDA